MSINWDACSAIATAVATAVALFLAVYNIRKGVINERKTIVDKAFRIALQLVDEVDKFNATAPHYSYFASQGTVKGRYLIRLLKAYGYSCNATLIFDSTVEVSYDELDRLFEQIKSNQ